MNKAKSEVNRLILKSTEGQDACVSESVLCTLSSVQTRTLKHFPKMIHSITRGSSKSKTHLEHFV